MKILYISFGILGVSTDAHASTVAKITTTSQPTKTTTPAGATIAKTLSTLTTSVSIQPSQTYEFDNTKNSEASFTYNSSNNGTYNYAIYNSNNSVKETGWNKTSSYSYFPSIPAGGKIIITASSSNAKNTLNCVWVNNGSIVSKAVINKASDKASLNSEISNTQKVVDALNKAISTAQAVLNNSSSTQNDINNALKALQQAKQSLIK